MLYANIHKISEAFAYNEDTFSVVKLKLDGSMFASVNLFFAPEQAEAVAQAINAAVEGGRK